MGFFSSLVNAFRKPKRDGNGELDSSRGQRQDVMIEMGRAGEQTHESRQSKRRSVSRPKSAHGKRRSWFGGRPDADEDVPAVPAIARPPQLNTNGEARQVPNQTAYQRRSSWFANNRRDASAARNLPDLPAMPVTVAQSSQPATATLPAEQRGRRLSMKSLNRTRSDLSVPRSVRSTKKKSKPFWSSSNPDDSDSEDVPPVPALVHDDQNSPNESFEEFQQQAARNAGSRTAGPKGVRPVSTTSRKSYTPRSAASGFLKSTNGATEGQRRSYRNSFKLEDGSDMVCLTDDQRVAWAQLMNEGAVFSDPQEAEPESKDDDAHQTTNRFSNAQALAALEFDMPR